VVDTIFFFDLIIFTRFKCSTKIHMLIRNSTFRSLSMFIAIINNNFTFHASVFKRFMIHIPIFFRNINMRSKGSTAINNNMRIKTIFSTKLLKISSFSERLNAIILIIYTLLAKCPRVAADSLLSFLFPSTLSSQ
jgi:hypothetical protein